MTKLNQMPVPTFSWLGVNGVEREICDNIAETITIGREAPAKYKIELKKSANVVASGGEKTRFLVMQIAGEKAYIQTTIHAGYGEKIKLVQIISGGDNTLKLNAKLAESAVVELVQIYLNCKDVISEAVIEMNGRKSAFTSNIGYTLGESNALDINLNVIQNGKKTESDITVKGVLRGGAKKIFRGTIDFRNGAVGATGVERENVLLLDENVINKTVPVILCAEEDVVGSHGATIGQIDANQLFYMQSRGMPEDEIYKYLAQSQLGSIVREIGDTETEQAVNRMLGREPDDE